jgi:membrane protease YdiL (CAAX protease family)|tara:strand:- start:1386 stop:1649 length:264 start_codon:yes stop_codon:yes gene_type:complete
MGLKWHNKWAGGLLVLFMSATWITALVVRAGTLHPTKLLTLMLEDVQGLGPLAFILDFIVLGIIFLWWRKRKIEKDGAKWESAFPPE